MEEVKIPWVLASPPKLRSKALSFDAHQKWRQNARPTEPCLAAAVIQQV